MKSRWSDSDAQEFAGRYVEKGVGEDLALRVYTTRLLGSDPRLVLHGGGNTSVKTHMTDLLGDSVEVICVKGSGWDMGNIEPAGLPAVKLCPLRRLRGLEHLSDEDMVNYQRVNLLDSSAPNPSVETLLHAFLPHKFVDHTHSTAVLALTDQTDGENLAREVFGERLAYVPYTIPGFALAKSVAEVFDRNRAVEGLVLLQHGIFAFGETAREAYQRMIAFVSMAEERLAHGRKSLIAARLPEQTAQPAEIAPILRGACTISRNESAGTAKRQILCFRNAPAILDYVNGAELARYSQEGVVTPDHTIRTKNWPLLVPAPEAGRLDVWKQSVEEAVSGFVARYHDYFARNNARAEPKKSELDPLPRVILVPRIGLFGLGASAKDAAIAADIAENTIEVITGGEAIGRYQPISEADMFDVEYWSLEQAKLGKSAEKPLARQVAVVTGGGSGIGAATARAMARAGAEVAVLDRDQAAAQAVARECGKSAIAIACDVTQAEGVKAAFERVATVFGGVDIVVSNAGAAWQGRIGAVGDSTLRQSFELNFFAHQNVAQNAVRIMMAQGTGGCLLFNVSKQAVNPGRDFGPYGLPKATTLFLMKQYALDHGRDGIRANAVNADRIRSGLLTDSMIATRSTARGVSENDYMSANLLGREVTAEDVADAFVWLATANKTTAAVVTVDGGNIEASLR
ncbi:MAG TPA: bifunctional aldolase/short-chain dehydrogenase [Rhizomicrobium sp.]|jgi:rhamnose utilization protein RhaD (predicted bifunctional aldolase and dehydrogenase)/NAD(P)-dependent dehydrogenase (short-subunit alcohol dehydrogenase family)|nr:bifunctional aldolase/short-chain dehydrogenase [Rhizomicrobium sp.]